MAIFKDKYLHIISALSGLKNFTKIRLIANSSERKRKITRICIYKLDHLGDLLFITPALKALRQNFPNAEIKIVVGEWGKAILKNNPNIDSIFYYNSKYFTRKPYKPFEFKILKNMLDKWKPELIFSLRGDWDTEFYNLCNNAVICERGSTQIIRKIQRIFSREKMYNEAFRIKNALQKIGVTGYDFTKHELYLDIKEIENAKNILTTVGLNKPFIAIHAGSVSTLRQWQSIKFANVAENLYKNYGLQILLVGSSDEEEKSQELADILIEINVPFVNLTGKLNIRLSAAIISFAELYLGNDGGMMHIAAALGVKTIGLFGPGSVDIFGVLGKNNISISKNFPCSPCNQEVCIRPNDNCMEAISTKEVIEAAQKLIQIRV